jgi:hypothetical protein
LTVVSFVLLEDVSRGVAPHLIGLGSNFISRVQSALPNVTGRLDVAPFNEEFSTLSLPQE